MQGRSLCVCTHAHAGRQVAQPSASAQARFARDLRAAKQEWSKKLLTPTVRVAAYAARSAFHTQRNVVGVGIAEKEVGGKGAGVQAVTFFVVEKAPLSKLSSQDRLPASIAGLPTDVEQTGRFVAQADPNPRRRMRPARPGSSVGFQLPGDERMAGTFGALVARGRKRFILSNNHVLANEDRLPVGSPIFQPGLLDGGDPQRDQIARLTQSVALNTANANEVDAAIAEALNPEVLTAAILRIGVPTGIQAAAQNMVVHKFGRTTGYTRGIVRSVAVDGTVTYDAGALYFEDQILIRGRRASHFSQGGDSGSLIVEQDTGRAVGLLFAGSDTERYTLANHIGPVLRQLRVRLA